MNFCERIQLEWTCALWRYFQIGHHVAFKWKFDEYFKIYLQSEILDFCLSILFSMYSGNNVSSQCATHCRSDGQLPVKLVSVR